MVKDYIASTASPKAEISTGWTTKWRAAPEHDAVLVTRPRPGRRGHHQARRHRPGPADPCRQLAVPGSGQRRRRAVPGDRRHVDVQSPCRGPAGVAQAGASRLDPGHGQVRADDLGRSGRARQRPHERGRPVRHGRRSCGSRQGVGQGFGVQPGSRLRRRVQRVPRLPVRCGLVGLRQSGCDLRQPGRSWHPDHGGGPEPGLDRRLVGSRRTHHHAHGHQRRRPHADLARLGRHAQGLRRDCVPERGSPWLPGRRRRTRSRSPTGGPRSTSGGSGR